MTPRIFLAFMLFAIAHGSLCALCGVSYREKPSMVLAELFAVLWAYTMFVMGRMYP